MSDKGIDTSGGLPKDQVQNAAGSGGGVQLGGGPEASDMAAPGGSSGEGGYGRAQNQQNHQGQGQQPLIINPVQSRGERYDEEQGGGRGSDSVSLDDDDLAEDQAAHQDRGQSLAADETERG